ncbi:MAG: hypothetical protein IPI09_15780 [Burkholderiales bacterium]|uniref:hypothetical protein n=1 Tax=Candidatus Aalborgicola defluviihabitans TaxID=3386187 RepID=UPI001D808012|nr:hypothetical protein [Burkholderiales bacterium]MBK7313248.1 hypothetical protein [Burkholderiales bacterium]MBL0244524.1 hypothetical protein [Rhodoferax sp.]
MTRAQRILAAVCLVWIASVWAQDTAAPGPDPLDEELARIGAVRQQKTAELDVQDASCMDRFAVTDCQNKVTIRRRQMLADLKRQEDEIKDAQRQQRAQQQLQRSADKAAENAQHATESEALQSSETERDRQKAQDEKVLSHQQHAKPVEPKASGPKIAAGLDADTRAKNRAAYQEKQEAAQKRREDRAQRLIDHVNGGPPLPAAP